MDALRKQATKFREQVAKQQQFVIFLNVLVTQAVIKQFSSSGYESSDVVVIDEVEMQRHQQLEKLYRATRSGKDFQKEIVKAAETFTAIGYKHIETGTKLSEDCCKYGAENNSENILAKAASVYGDARKHVEKEHEELNRLLSTQVLDPLRQMINGAPLEDARHLAQRYSRMRQEAEALLWGTGRYLTLPFPFSFGVLNATDCHSSAILSDYVNTTIFILLNMWKKFGILDLGGCSQKTATGEEKCQYRDTLGRTLNNYEREEIARRKIRVRESQTAEHVSKLHAAEAKMQELKANMAVLGKEASAALAAVEAQQQRLTFQRLVAMVEGEKTFHLRVAAILGEIEAEMVSDRQKKESAPPVTISENGSEKTMYFLAEATHPFSAESEKELSFSKGDFVVVRKVNPSGWSEGECNGRAGWFPSAYVEKRQRIPSSNSASEVF
ncbi:hypothetical protein V8G54_004874 [Vigna mungo]|uniref:SH3 domain-containing protein n=1 Tax=Vigna mungo TaxID=3915 RepID=A0AAQ3PIU5_VIGMU